MPLSQSQRKHLKALCHHLQPVVTIADKGLSPTVTEALTEALNHHELIKVKLRLDRDHRPAMIDQLVAQMGAEPVMVIGGVVCLYRQNRDKPKDKQLKLPKP